MTFCKPGMHDGQQTPGSAVVLARGWAHVAFDWLIREVADYTTIYNPNGGLVKAGLLPIVTGSNSGGSMFATRYFALRTTPSATKWSYPCYLLAEPYRTVCYYHAGFGDISQECESETMNVLNLATATVYGGIMTAYGGPLGTASVFLYVYFPFLSGLPVRSKNLQWSEFVKKNVMFSTSFGLPSNWVAAHTLDSPIAAGTPTYNYGFDSYLSRACRAYSVQGSTWSMNAMGNVSVAWSVAVSANVQSALVLMPYALASKTWDAQSASSPVTPALRIFALLVVIRKMLPLSSRTHHQFSLSAAFV